MPVQVSGQPAAVPATRERARLAVDPVGVRVFEHGWQSWSPTTTYRPGDVPLRPASETFRRTGWRPEVTSPADAFWGEGLLAVQVDHDEPVHVFAARSALFTVPSIRADLRDDHVIISATEPSLIDEYVCDGSNGVQGALAAWADSFAARSGVPAPRPAPTVWSSWYQYFGEVSQADVIENLVAMDTLGLPVDVVQVDDGYQSAVGDWLLPSSRFASLPDLASRITDTGRRAGIWVAPFLAAENSVLARAHPDWLVRDVTGGPLVAHQGWNVDTFALDLTHPQVLNHLAEVFRTLRDWGFDFFKLDFLYAGAMHGWRVEDRTGVEAYRSGLELIRSALGDDAYVLGSGAPMLPSVGLVDAMRVSPDTAPHFQPGRADLSIPGQRCAALSGSARAFQHARFWANDPDCLLARPGVELRRQWAQHIDEFGGLRGSSDRLLSLDAWGLDTTRRLLADPPTAPLVTATPVLRHHAVQEEKS